MSLQFTQRNILLFIMICILLLSPLQVKAEEFNHTVKKGKLYGVLLNLIRSDYQKFLPRIVI
ncbi:hypothetical protein [Metabacillus endolithicus]|uniref:Uncharacterized protein n=1 Tax=Metabacillus endolithicus TaxID=1535204 RepID=A0ABW5BSD3_9BACI|nr:hypothetical protein [Metabacillus endolithicus]UPG63155.1 hypothetical protein MVE64_22910 [Metabacillus endolithicus]